MGVLLDVVGTQESIVPVSRMNRLIERIADILAAKPGLLPIVGLGLVILNFLLQIYPGSSYWVVDSNLLLHLGLVIGFLGFLLIRALG